MQMIFCLNLLCAAYQCTKALETDANCKTLNCLKLSLKVYILTFSATAVCEWRVPSFPAVARPRLSAKLKVCNHSPEVNLWDQSKEM